MSHKMLFSVHQKCYAQEIVIVTLVSSVTMCFIYKSFIRLVFVTQHKCHATSEIFVTRRSSFHIVVIVKLAPRHDVLERGNGVSSTYVTAKQCHADCHCSSEEEKAEHCLARSDAYSVTCRKENNRKDYIYP